MTPASTAPDPGATAAIAALAVAVDRFIRGRRDAKREDRADAREERTEASKEAVDLIAAAIALADERREGEHDCRAELAELRGELLAERAERRMEAVELRALLAECERKHAATSTQLELLVASPRNEDHPMT